MAHCLNLCLQDAAKMSTIVRDCLGLIGEISQLIHYSPKRRPPKRIDDGSESHVFETPEDYYRKTYFEVIDIIVLELSQRFSQESLRIPLQIESTLLKATNMVSDVENGNIDETLLKFYAKDLDGKKLLRQIAMLPDLVNEIKKTSPYDHLKSVTNVRVLADILKHRH